MPYKSTKTYTHEVGLSSCFRQHNAKSHCRFLHGYALQFKFTFAAMHLDENNWVVDFGSLKPLRKNLEQLFDHKLIVARDDPNLETFKSLEQQGLAQLTILEHVGCEAFAATAYTIAYDVVRALHPRVWVVSAECHEHGANSAIYEGALTRV